MNKKQKLLVARTQEYRVALFGDDGTKRSKETPEQRAYMEGILSQSTNEMMRTLATNLRDPMRARASIGYLAQELAISWQDIATEVKAITSAVGEIRQYQHLPDIMEQTAIAARNETIVCIKCEGTGKVDRLVTVKGEKPKREVKTCPECVGKGTIIRLGDIERVKLIYESSKLTGQKAPLVALQQNFSNLRGETMEDLILTTEPLVSKVIDNG